MKVESSIEFLGDVQRLQLKPGDVVVLRTKATLSQSQRNAIADAITKVLEPDRKLLILDRDMEIGVLHHVKARG